MKHYFTDVPGLGNVAVSRHAQKRAEEERIPDPVFVDVLSNGKDVPEGFNVVWREAHGVRLVIVLRPEPFRGAALVTTAFRVQSQAKA
jgi:hypothetical protein